jgi:N-acetylmuramoyl-L-alanine amidase
MNIEFLKSPNFEQRETEKKLIVIHHTAGAFAGVLDHFTNPASKVSAHYVVSVSGTVVQMVDEKYIAWHCNPSNSRNLKTFIDIVFEGLNHCSIGIELEGPPSFLGLNKWPDVQIQTCADLCRMIAARHWNILLTDHSTIDNGLGKIDVKKNTGIDLFPWETLVNLSGVPDASVYPI